MQDDFTICRWSTVSAVKSKTWTVRYVTLRFAFLNRFQIEHLQSDKYVLNETDKLVCTHHTPPRCSVCQLVTLKKTKNQPNAYCVTRVRQSINNNIASDTTTNNVYTYCYHDESIVKSFLNQRRIRVCRRLEMKTVGIYSRRIKRVRIPTLTCDEPKIEKNPLRHDKRMRSMISQRRFFDPVLGNRRRLKFPRTLLARVTYRNANVVFVTRSSVRSFPFAVPYTRTIAQGARVSPDDNRFYLSSAFRWSASRRRPLNRHGNRTATKIFALKKKPPRGPNDK